MLLKIVKTKCRYTKTVIYRCLDRRLKFSKIPETFLPTLLGKTSEQQQHEFLYWEFHEGQYSKVAVRMGDWKAVQMTPHSAVELYNLKNDIEEINNVASQNPDIVKEIQKYLKKARTKSEHWEIRS